MKIIMKPIEVISWSTIDGALTPLRFRINEKKENPEVSNIIVKVNKILLKKEEKLAGKKTIIYRCQSMINKTEKIYELKYEIQTCRWFLYKI
ncbi:hypothetical protein [Natranaerofaba carboxydovora]|uniref:hypothetical protein n=1 Tax=Natranaerofaba carboxydovora TaxID=2742683 RepID=UPI001F12A1E4|nr:hypothetical protein [Natranaerofaba carboxydovora]UMZ75448.1 hypothetical protein ACONDI_03076 [Natranaerofaba carboxydovora]